MGEAVRMVRPGDPGRGAVRISCGACPACRNRLTGNCRSVPPISMYGFGVAELPGAGSSPNRSPSRTRTRCSIPLLAGVDPVAVVALPTHSVMPTATLAIAWSGSASTEGPGIILFGAMRRRSVFGASVPMPRRSPARSRLMCSSLRLEMTYESTPHG